MSDLVSIITPCYNSGKYLAETIESVLQQTYQNWEWIIVDDCSEDNSTEIIKKYTDDSRILLLEQTKNVGAAVARNIALEKASGRFITFLDSDDLWLPTFLEKSINFLKNNNETLVYASYKRVDEQLQPKLKDFIAEDHIDYNRMLYNCPIPMLTAMYDSSSIGKVPIPIVEKREDHAMWLMILSKTKEARAIKESLGIYRMRENSYSRNKFEILFKQFNVYYEFLELPLHKSVYYTISWALNGLKKYGRF